MLLGSPNKNIYFGSPISSLMVMERKSRIEGDKYAVYVVPNDASADILLSIRMRFGLISECWILKHVQYLGVDHWIQHKYCTLVWCSIGPILHRYKSLGKKMDESGMEAGD